MGRAPHQYEKDGLWEGGAAAQTASRTNDDCGHFSAALFSKIEQDLEDLIFLGKRIH